MAFRLGQATVDPPTRTIVVGGQARHLAPKPADVLAVLAAADGEVVSRDDLLSQVWPNVYVGEEVLTQAIAELRRAFGDSARSPRYVQTIHKSGYRLIPPVEGMQAELSPALPAELETDEAIAAISHYMNAWDIFALGGIDNTERAIEEAQRSVALDPSFAPARAVLAGTLIYKGVYYSHGPSLVRQGLATAEGAVQCDPRAPEGYASKGLALATQGDWQAAVRAFNMGMRLSPDSFFLLYFYGRALYSNGYHAAATQVFAHASNIRGDEFHGLMLSGTAAAASGDHQLAAAQYRRAAFRAGQRLEVRPDDLRAKVCDLYCHLKLHGLKDAEPKLLELQKKFDPVMYYVAAALAKLGERNLALDWLEEAVDRGWSDGQFLTHDHDMDALRGEPRFARLKRRFEGKSAAA